MMSQLPYKYAHLSEPDPAWLSVAEKQAEADKLIAEMYRLPIAEFRKLPYRKTVLPSNVPLPDKDLTIRTDTFTARDGVTIGIRIYEPLDKKIGHPLFLNVHGGGWTVGGPDAEEPQNRFIAVENKAVVVSVDYRLAPEHPFPTPLHDNMDALQWCVEHAADLGIDVSKILVGGGSAGANLVAAMTLLCRDNGIPGLPGGVLCGQILNIPVTCHPDHFPAGRYEYHSFEQNQNAPIITSERMHLFWNYYIPSEDAADPLASPLLASSLANLPAARTSFLFYFGPRFARCRPWSCCLSFTTPCSRSSRWPRSPP